MVTQRTDNQKGNTPAAEKPWLWKPGQTGNPNGRPPGILARDKARAYTDLAIATLVKALEHRQTMVPAAVALLDRGWGKPKETVDTTNLHVMVGGIDAPPIPETLEAWLQRRHSELARIKAIEHESKPDDSEGKP